MCNSTIIGEFDADFTNWYQKYGPIDNICGITQG